MFGGLKKILGLEESSPQRQGNANVQNSVVRNPIAEQSDNIMRNSVVQPQNRLQVTQGGMQPRPGVRYEDEFAPADALENTGYYRPQTSLNGQLQQGSLPNLQQDPYQRLRNILGF